MFARLKLILVPELLVSIVLFPLVKVTVSLLTTSALEPPVAIIHLSYVPP